MPFLTFNDRVNAFDNLGCYMDSIPEMDLSSPLAKTQNQNAWFTPENVRMALQGIRKWLSQETLERWLSSYRIPDNPKPKTIGVVMPGNIPLVGFHDFLCVLLAGHRIHAKLSSQDNVLLPFLADKLVEIEPRFKELIFFPENLSGVDALIATGSNNSARYFEYYFRNVPRIIRKNRTSVSVIQGDEPATALAELGTDIFSYFGLGCRNVSKLYVPPGFDLQIITKHWERFNPVILHPKYENNYNYQKAILVVNRAEFIDTGFALLVKSNENSSPVSVLYYDEYDERNLDGKINVSLDSIQSIGSHNAWYPDSTPFGQLQFPEVGDYADRVDTMRFLSDLN